MAELVKARLTNIAPGARGVWAQGDLIDIAKGAVRTLDFTDVKELEQVDRAAFRIETSADVDFNAPQPERMFLALVDGDGFKNFRTIDLGSATQVGMAQGVEAPMLPDGYRWGPITAPAVAASSDDAPGKLPALTGKGKDALLAIAVAEDVTVPDGATNSQIIDAITAKRATA